MIKKETDIIDSALLIKEVVAEVRSDIEETEQDLSLYEEKNFERRQEVAELIDLHIIGRLDGLPAKTNLRDELLLLKDRAEKIKSALEKVDNKLFEKLRENIKAGVYSPSAFKELITHYIGIHQGEQSRQKETGYDNLDLFVNGLFSHQAMPEQAKDLEPEMVYYQKTPARIVFELVEKCGFTKDDVFFDIGSGLGQVAILVNLLSGITTKGLEFEPAFCDYANMCVAELKLPDVTFVNIDAQQADYSTGTVFFMFTPFKGRMLQEVLEILRKEALKRKIRIVAYGPCIAEVALGAGNWELITIN